MVLSLSGMGVIENAGDLEHEVIIKRALFQKHHVLHLQKSPG